MIVPHGLDQLLELSVGAIRIRRGQYAILFGQNNGQVRSAPQSSSFNQRINDLWRRGLSLVPMLRRDHVLTIHEQGDHIGAPDLEEIAGTREVVRSGEVVFAGPITDEEGHDLTAGGPKVEVKERGLRPGARPLCMWCIPARGCASIVADFLEANQRGRACKTDTSDGATL